ncbi:MULTISPECIES: GNAT family N-acetyltransferase [Rhodopseudomonas]|uniref:N-acetyltransferase domain-containing protein n=1 Tax=Rhodopseudomonas palustris TaxID=1076 RepID=A0A0D7F7P1_RHOPL|nr:MULTISPECIES: GNAT family N-acetyltransferase [Rhodopseudomonas]KIZ47717.1 hypothetical protein OO17_02825 [Rhodopseudomonas palustris]MDF3808757.1 GNAT family N-acetyltransferase [Rhodopseudomonas sp. BAL398]WOK16456.1 GNAT family N-acetyltransferase [Rhodopseudomonas sp. BAL398]
MRITRRAEPDDLESLIDLYRHANPDTPRLSQPCAQQIWAEILAAERTVLFVTAMAGRLVSTCCLTTGPNLMRGGASHALLENVVTHREFRRQGHGRATIAAALQEAWSRGCFQVFLVTGRGHANPYVHDFYRSVGFAELGKTAFVARPPDQH